MVCAGANVPGNGPLVATCIAGENSAAEGVNYRQLLLLAQAAVVDTNALGPDLAPIIQAPGAVVSTLHGPLLGRLAHVLVSFVSGSPYVRPPRTWGVQCEAAAECVGPDKQQAFIAVVMPIEGRLKGEQVVRPTHTAILSRN